jgi:23S rRNA pseudouridine2605 synthase
MTDTHNDDTPGPEQGADKPAPDAGPWKPATDAGSETIPENESPKARRRAGPAGDDTLRRRPTTAAPEAPPTDTEAEPDATFAGERIAKAMARAGVASRRDAEAMILEGRVSVNGEVIASPALNVTDADTIMIDGEPLPTRERTRLWIFHKPRGLVTTARDPEGRQTVFEVLPEEMPRVVAVGRLDINTEGLLLLTNDGGLAKVIAHPDTGWLRRYRVRAHGDTDQAQLDRLAKGVTIDGMEYGPIEATLDRVQGDNLWLTLGLREGKNREVKRILEHLGLQVNRLIRLSFGPFQLGDLEVGLVDEVKTRVLKDQLGKGLAEQAGVDFESPVREPITPFGGPAKPARAEGGQGQGQSRRDAARPAPQRVSTGGAGSNLRKSVWRDDGDEQRYRPGRAPRRGSDPREAQAAAAAVRGRERVGAIKSGDRRILVERLSPTPAQPAREEAPRRRYAKPGPGRSEAPAPFGEDRRERPPARGGAPRDGARPFRHPEGGENRAPRSRSPGQGEGGSYRGERGAPPRGRSDDRGDAGGRSNDRRGPREDGGFGGKPPRGRSDSNEGFRGRPRPAGKDFGGDRPAGGRPGGARGEGGKPGGARPGGKPGGFKAGGFKPGGSKPGGFKSGGSNSGGPRSGGPKSGGPKSGGPRGGGGGGGGRPPRAGR